MCANTHINYTFAGLKRFYDSMNRFYNIASVNRFNDSTKFDKFEPVTLV